MIFTKDGDALSETKEVVVQHTRRNLEQKKEMFQGLIASHEAEIKAIDALLKECDKLGL